MRKSFHISDWYRIRLFKRKIHFHIAPNHKHATDYKLGVTDVSKNNLIFFSSSTISDPVWTFGGKTRSNFSLLVCCWSSQNNGRKGALSDLSDREKALTIVIELRANQCRTIHIRSVVYVIKAPIESCLTTIYYKKLQAIYYFMWNGNSNTKTKSKNQEKERTNERTKEDAEKDETTIMLYIVKTIKALSHYNRHIQAAHWAKERNKERDINEHDPWQYICIRWKWTQSNAPSPDSLHTHTPTTTRIVLSTEHKYQTHICGTSIECAVHVCVYLHMVIWLTVKLCTE